MNKGLVWTLIGAIVVIAILALFFMRDEELEDNTLLQGEEETTDLFAPEAGDPAPMENDPMSNDTLTPPTDDTTQEDIIFDSEEPNTVPQQSEPLPLEQEEEEPETDLLY